MQYWMLVFRRVGLEIYIQYRDKNLFKENVMIYFYFWFLGNDGGLDFGIVKVGQEEKLICYLKNKGKFEI